MNDQPSQFHYELEKILQIIPEGVIVCDSQWRVSCMNAAAAALVALV
jgi:sensor histidine kinase regulating citrate/malate metabolism